ncbi:XerC Integrase [Caulobacteraceae bacterium]
MGSISARNGVLWFDFRYQDRRCRETSRLPDTPANRKRLEQAAKRIEAEITLGHFDYAKWFPDSNKVGVFTEMEIRRTAAQADTPVFEEFAEVWFAEKSIEWRRSYRGHVRRFLDAYHIPRFMGLPVATITKAQILALRASIANKSHSVNSAQKLSAVTVNQIMLPLRMVLSEAADRFEFQNPWSKIKMLKQQRPEVEPFSLEEVFAFLEVIRPDFHDYFVVRFFTGLRSSEIDALRWQNVDIEKKRIYVREALVKGHLERTKTDGSTRSVQINQLVCDALNRQWIISGHRGPGGLVFCNSKGEALDGPNVVKRVWHPALRYLKMRPRRPYQTRHTAATLWLAAGESPEWIARQLGHTTTQMLFKVYSRYVPNLTRNDGSAFEAILAQQTRNATLPDKGADGP